MEEGARPFSSSPCAYSAYSDNENEYAPGVTQRGPAAGPLWSVAVRLDQLPLDEITAVKVNGSHTLSATTVRVTEPF